MYCVPVDSLPVVFPKVSELLRRSFAVHDKDIDPDTRVAELRDLLERDLVTMWVLFDPTHEHAQGVLVLGLLEYDKRRTVEIYAAATTGEGIDWEQHLHLIREYALEHGATAIEFDGRIGWSKVLVRHGFRAIQIRMLAEVQP